MLFGVFGYVQIELAAGWGSALSNVNEYLIISYRVVMKRSYTTGSPANNNNNNEPAKKKEEEKNTDTWKSLSVINQTSIV